MTESDWISDLRAKLEEEAAADRFSGAVLVAKHARTVFAQAYGLADRERGVPNALRTRFRIGSMGKMFTAVAVLQLAQAGRLRLADPLGAHLADHPNRDVASKVTIQQLLNHTGGTGDLFGPEFDARRRDVRTLRDFVNLHGGRAPRFEPGSRWEYSNYGFILLGAVIEEVSGQGYYDRVRDRVHAPAGMPSTGSEPEEAPVPDRSVGYTRAAGTTLRPDTGLLPHWRPNTGSLPFRGSPAGGGYSTVQDLLNFANALRNRTLLDARHTELLTAGGVETDHGTRYACGFEHRTAHGARCYGHSGGAIGMNGDLEIFPDTGHVAVVLANLDPPAAGRISALITDGLGRLATADAASRNTSS